MGALHDFINALSNLINVLSKEQLINFANVIVAAIGVLASVLLSLFTARSERKKYVGEIQRKMYFDLLKHLTKLEDNPTLIYNLDYYTNLKELKLAMDVYADKSIQPSFNKLFKEVKTKYNDYFEAFESEKALAQQERERERDPSYDEKLETAKGTYRKTHTADSQAVKDMIAALKEKVTIILRRG